MVNRVTLVGNLGSDPEIRVQESGVKMARLRVATTERLFIRESNNYREHTEWHTVILWRALADFADIHLRKGSQIYLEGALRHREWTDRQGVSHSAVEIACSELKVLGRKEITSREVESPAVNVVEDDMSSKIPF